jgi:hypothetical protein
MHSLQDALKMDGATHRTPRRDPVERLMRHRDAAGLFVEHAAGG